MGRTKVVRVGAVEGDGNHPNPATWLLVLQAGAPQPGFFHELHLVDAQSVQTGAQSVTTVLQSNKGQVDFVVSVRGDGNFGSPSLFLLVVRSV
jgi:hypothetical protein